MPTLPVGMRSRVLASWLGLVAAGCGSGASPDAAGSTSPLASSAPTPTSSSEPAPMASNGAPIAHQAGTVPSAVAPPRTDRAPLPAVAPKLETLPPAPAKQKAPTGLDAATWLDGTHVALRAPGRLEVVEALTGARVALTTGARILEAEGDARRVVTLDESNRVVVWDLQGAAPPRAWQVEPAPDAWANPVAIAPSGDRIAFGGAALDVWDADGKRLFHAAVDTAPFDVLVTRDQAFTSSNNSSIQAWSLADGKTSGAASFATGATFGIAISPDGRWAAGASPAGHGMEVAEIRQAGSQRQLVQTDDCAHHVSVAFSRDSRRVYASLGSDWVKGFETGTWKPYASFHAEPGLRIESSSDDLGRVVTSRDGRSPAVVVVSSAQATPLEHAFDGEASYAINEDGTLVLGVDDRYAVRIWSTRTHDVIHEVTPDGSP